VSFSTLVSPLPFRHLRACKVACPRAVIVRRGRYKHRSGSLLGSSSNPKIGSQHSILSSTVPVCGRSQLTRSGLISEDADATVAAGLESFVSARNGRSEHGSCHLILRRRNVPPWHGSPPVGLTLPVVRHLFCGNGMLQATPYPRQSARKIHENRNHRPAAGR
jgi:hypothetical protein